MKIITQPYGKTVKPQDMVKILSNVRSEYSRIAMRFENYKSMVFVSDRQAKPNGVWQRVINIEDDGRTYFYKTATLYGGSEKWVKVGDSENVKLIHDWEIVGGVFRYITAD